MSDAADITLAVSGDTVAFERLYRRHVPRVHTLARRMIGPELADDVTQDVFVRVWEKLHTFRGTAQFSTWLYRLAVNVILARRAQAGRLSDRFRQADHVLDGAAAPRTRVDVRMDMEEAMGRLPPRAREVFVLHDVEGYKHREIADMLGITAGTSKSQLHEARMTLREHLR
ncbi:MAG TPA: sigma-70 family RNA polymerase sigma factor [Longimicrobiales bacterium]|nr:sigma-70 family RNA polymerase sigma factor [Longimicrobiales bacterium]